MSTQNSKQQTARVRTENDLFEPWTLIIKYFELLKMLNMANSDRYLVFA